MEHIIPLWKLCFLVLCKNKYRLYNMSNWVMRNLTPSCSPLLPHQTCYTLDLVVIVCSESTPNSSLKTFTHFIFYISCSLDKQTCPWMDCLPVSKWYFIDQQVSHLNINQTLNYAQLFVLLCYILNKNFSNEVLYLFQNSKLRNSVLDVCLPFFTPINTFLCTMMQIPVFIIYGELLLQVLA